MNFSSLDPVFDVALTASFASLIIFCLVLLLFNTTRLFGIIVLTMITYSYPMMLILIIALSATYFYFTHLK